MSDAANQLKLRTETELRDFVEAEARRCASSLSSEDMRCIQHRMEARGAAKVPDGALLSCAQDGRASDG